MGRFIHYGAVLLAIAGISASLLAGANKLTAPTIAKIEKESIDTARKEVLGSATAFVEEEAVDVKGDKFIPGKDGSGNIVGYVSTLTTAGYAGPINFVLGIDKEGVVTGLKVTGSVETPGLGSKINEEDWQKHWIGKSGDHEFNKAEDAFAGATISPEAVYKKMVESINAFKGGNK